jgi:hypothetical protein
MVQRVYSHLGEIRYRSEVIENRVGQHKEVLGLQVTGTSGQKLT